jgi:hypothetical protein
VPTEVRVSGRRWVASVVGGHDPTSTRQAYRDPPAAAPAFTIHCLLFTIHLHGLFKGILKNDTVFQSTAFALLLFCALARTV